jgi:hypothetical protein
MNLDLTDHEAALLLKELNVISPDFWLLPAPDRRRRQHLSSCLQSRAIKP